MWQCFHPACSMKTKSLNDTCIVSKVTRNAKPWWSRQLSRQWTGRCSTVCSRGELSLGLLLFSWHFSCNQIPGTESPWWPLTRWRALYQGLAGPNLLSAGNQLSWGFLTSVRLSVLQQQLQLLMCDHLIVWKILHFCGIKSGVHFIKAAAIKRIIFQECLLTCYWTCLNDIGLMICILKL